MNFTKTVSAAAFAALVLGPVAAHAAGDAFAPNGLIEAAEAAGVCGDAAVLSAELTDQNTISATCADSDLAAVPLLGSVGGAGAAAIAGALVLGAVLAASNDDDGDAVAPADTQ